MALADYIGRFWTGAEVMYGVIIAMTFTSMLRGSPAVFGQVLFTIIFAALFCCIAWGIADGLFYFWERGYLIRQQNRIIQLAKSPQREESALVLIEEQLEDTILRTIPRENRLRLYRELVQYVATIDEREKMPARAAVTIIAGTFCLSAGAGVIIVSPFFLVPDVDLALKISNSAGILLLFGIGYLRARDVPFSSKVLFGLGSAFIGIFIAGITIVLGG
jgi:hypothetical protein